jgi:hypothetical protein
MNPNAYDTTASISRVPEFDNPEPTASVDSKTFDQGLADVEITKRRLSFVGRG